MVRGKLHAGPCFSPGVQWLKPFAELSDLLCVGLLRRPTDPKNFLFEAAIHLSLLGMYDRHLNDGKKAQQSDVTGGG